MTTNAKLYDAIIAPMVTEKSTMASGQGKVTFKVRPDATKVTIKKAVEEIFKVKVEKVNTINIQGKEKRYRGMKGRRNDVRKAIVTLAEGQNIDFTAGAK